MRNSEYYNTNSYVQLISRDIRALHCLQAPYTATRIEKEKKRGETKISQPPNNNKLCIFTKQP
jgi:hypothetical protein